MPAFATHDIFGEEAWSAAALDGWTRAVCRHPEVFRLGCQGPDIFFFHPSVIGKSRKQGLGSRMHETETSRFFGIYLEELLSVRRQSAFDTGVSYLFGFLSHYALDAAMHPYVYSKAGFEAGVPDSARRTFPAHQRLEAVIDQKMLMAKRNLMPSLYHSEKRILLSPEELGDVAGLMGRVLRRVYHTAFAEERFRLSYHCMRLVMRQVYDHTGRRRAAVQFFESSVLHCPVIGNMMVSDTLPDRMDAMNGQRRVWADPWDPDKTFDSSVWELYDNAVEPYRGYVGALEPVLQKISHRLCVWGRRRRRNCACQGRRTPQTGHVPVRAYGRRETLHNEAGRRNCACQGRRTPQSGHVPARTYGRREALHNEACRRMPAARGARKGNSALCGNGRQRLAGDGQLVAQIWAAAARLGDRSYHSGMACSGCSRYGGRSERDGGSTWRE